ncbi:MULTISPECIES: glucose-specific PTS transporter subunit IIBC [Turicibacter]|jgi:PTS system, glucose-specific IIBC component|uniref:PTS sugar transporter subunit IIA n=3 Tax=Turicibacter sanguinis TaxID=154288 RepID=A0A173UIF5_9FIRM|nr:MULTISPECIES: glucose-specific PTS transporter subunit IIBC [Turicibacter]EFF63294.1 PTS system, glucose-specific IIBC component [Turicibacter sanguinis PC909]MBP3904455.1 PTS transporter subunit EIIC [Turicibacter sp.]MCU7191459.1 glucose-specific PTS transporter subunit IIBC [Turicibacter sanguinis]MCU7196574.1 glucose-specific PTS transporter subunit IIBC [Turicibacter sanguinis]MCU7203286.1 glucose-specific PTS transporter subunit IIBC [Turicibacter sanguinis]
MKTLQRVGKAFMVPVALLPAAGLLLGIGASMQQSLLDYLPFLGTEFWQMVAMVMKSSGQIVFDNLPLLFAIGVASGLTGDKGVAALAATVGFLIMNVVIGVFMPVTLPDQLYANVLGIETLQTSVFGGVLIGLLTAYLYNKFYTVKFPDFLSFFAGARFVPIITSVVAIIVGVILAFIWPPIGNLIASFGKIVAAEGTNPLYIWIYGIAERALIPFGLHHVFYFPLWYTEAGGIYTSIDGVMKMGDQQIWFQQLADYSTYGYQAMIENVQAQGATLAGRFMTGKYPFMIFGLPAAAYAMYQEAAPARKKAIGGLLLSAGLTAALTGITEPIEFTFLFVAPVLFAIHAVLAGLSFMLMYLFNVHVGMTFSGGLIDLLIYGILPGNDFTNWVRIIIVGIFYAPIYYFLFRFAIRRFNLPTPGRGEAEDKLMSKADYQAAKGTNSSEKAAAILEALGGASNIETLDACMSRLRVSVHDIDEVDETKIKALGATGMFVSGNNLQAIFGTTSDQLKTQIEAIMAKEK